MIIPPVAFFMLGALLMYILICIVSRSSAPALSKHSMFGFFVSPGFFKRTEEDIRLLKEETVLLLERYQVLTENLAAAIIVRRPNGQIAYCSPYTEVLTGYAADTFYDETQDAFLESIHEDDREKYKRALEVTHLGEAFQFRYRFFHRTGIEMWAETRIVPILDDEGELASSLSVTIDVTGPVRHQKEIEAQKRDLEDFSYMISHDLKAPIFTIKGMLHVIKEDFENESRKMEEPLGFIESASQRVEELVNSVLDYSKVSNADTVEENLELKDIFRDIINDFQAQIKEADAKLIISEILPAVKGDKVKVYQIFSNLIGNALKYRDPKRSLEINVQEAKINNPRMVAISVTDTGLGIPADKLEDIFRPFQRIHSQDIEGTGIGLACVSKLLQKLGGEIDVQSEQGKGSVFSVHLRRQ